MTERFPTGVDSHLSMRAPEDPLRHFTLFTFDT
jgi:hypothetical protein